MFARLILLKQRTEESVNDFSKRFIRTAHAAHVPDNNILARLYMNSLTKYLHVNVRTSLSSNFGPRFLEKLVSFRQVEALVIGLEVNNGGAITTAGEKDKKYSSKVKGEEHKRSSKPCVYCGKPWEHGHRCTEFLKHKEKKDKQQQVRSIRIDSAVNQWTNFANSQRSDSDKLIDEAIDSIEES
ncbi:hypothetical protein, partial, partial [Parasitella parasitica]